MSAPGRAAEPDRAMLAPIKDLFVAADDALQSAVDAASFALQRLGVRKPAQVAALHLVAAFCITLSARDLRRAGAEWKGVAGFAVLWVLLAAIAFWLETIRERIAKPRARDRFMRCVVVFLLLSNVTAWARGLRDGYDVSVTVLLLVAVYLGATPPRPPPRRRRRWVWMPAEARA